MTKFKAMGQYLYYIGLFLYVFSYNIQYSYAHNDWIVSQSPMLMVIKIMRYAAYLFCIIHLVSLYKINIYTISVAIILFVAAVYATYTGPQKAPIFYSILLITGIKTDFRKCVKIFLFIQLTTFIIYISLSQMGISGSDVIEDQGRLRSFLGYGWVNRASYCWFFVCLEILYLRENRINLSLGLVLSFVNYFIYARTNTKFSMLMTFLVIGYGVLKQYRCKIFGGKRRIKLRTISRMAVFLFVLSIVVGVVLPLMYNPNNPIMAKLNGLATGRLGLGKTAIERYGLHLGGNKIQWVGSSTLMFGLSDGTEYFYVDNGFLQLSLEFGLLFTAFIVFIYIASIRISCKLGKSNLAMIIVILGVLFVFEPYAVDFAFNPFVLYFFSSFRNKKNNEKCLTEQINNSIMRKGYNTINVVYK